MTGQLATGDISGEVHSSTFVMTADGRILPNNQSRSRLTASWPSPQTVGGEGGNTVQGRGGREPPASEEVFTVCRGETLDVHDTKFVRLQKKERLIRVTDAAPERKVSCMVIVMS